MIVGMYSSISGLRSFEKQLESITDNVANINTDEFKKTRVTLYEGKPLGVTPHVERTLTPGPMVYEETGNGLEMVEKSNVDLGEELPRLMLTKRYYQANLKLIRTEDEMLGSLLDVKG